MVHPEAILCTWKDLVSQWPSDHILRLMKKKILIIYLQYPLLLQIGIDCQYFAAGMGIVKSQILQECEVVVLKCLQIL